MASLGGKNWAALIAACAGACFSPDYGEVAFECGADRRCRAGYECREDNLCHRYGSPGPDANRDSSPAMDALTVDAHPHDTCLSPATLVPGVPLTDSFAGASDDELGADACFVPGAEDVVYTFTTDQDYRVR